MMDWVKPLVEIVNEVGRRDISIGHLFLILLYTLERGVIGRYTLSSRLRLSEATVRNILEKLKERNILEAIRGGHRLTNYGKDIVSRITNVIKIGDTPKSACLKPYSKLIQVKGLGERIPDVIDIRDEVVRMGGRGAVILWFKGGDLIFPDSGLSVDVWNKDIKRDLFNMYELDEGDLILITYAENELDALLSGLNVAFLIKMGELE